MTPPTPEPSARFVHTRARADDLGEIVALMYESFSSLPQVAKLLMGCKSAADFPKLVDLYTKSLEQDPTDLWTKVVDVHTGAIAAASNWKLYLRSARSQPRPLDEPPPWLEGEEAALSMAMLEPLNGPRIAMNQDPFLHLHICFTSPAYRRRGLASKMVQWGCDLADLLSLPGWIEASMEGSLLYKQHGFYNVLDIVQNGEKQGICMRRDAVVGTLAARVDRPEFS
ncbi:hypothetical protein AC578_6935 [Pseudocercospora eumusae]|uniref:N-acetyltransferase domain-containing protein n=1 Tax=Pseudocercospora eumusae TaxID=321146 RepID=A0A139GYF3_9PEZI|nr:hypothetical protein AC578_6935 [Pseudocercospora eumusae]